MFGEIVGFLSSIFKPAAELVDDLHTSKEEKLELKNTLTGMQNQLKVRLEEEVTKRWEADSKSDSWLSKNIRPMTLVYLMGLLTLFALTDGNIGSFTINAAYITLFQALAVTAFGGYFVLRGVEKVADKRKK
jgi:hypothetical protein